VSPLRARIGAAVFFAAAVLLCFQYRVVDKPLMADTQHYFYLSERAASGVAPHISHVDSKTMLSSLITGAAIRVGRSVEIDDVTSARIVSVASVAASVALLWLLALALTNSPRSAFLAALAGLAMWPLFQEGTMGARPKVFLVTFMLLSHLAAARRRSFSAGLWGMGAFLCWQPGLLAVGAAGLAAIAGERPVRRTIAVLSGAAAGLFFYEAYFYAHGALNEQIYQTFQLPGGTPWSQFSLTDGLAFIFWEGRSFLPSGAILSVIAAVATMSIWLRTLSAPLETAHNARLNPGWLAVWAGFHVAVAFTALDHQGYPDLLLVMPYTALLAGCGAGWLLDVVHRSGARSEGQALGALLVLLFGFAGFHSAARFGQIPKATLEDQLKLGELTAIYLEHTPKVWASGCTHLLAFNRSPNHVPYGFFYDDIIRELNGTGWRPLRNGEMPDIILISRGIFGETNRWMRLEYEEITPHAFREQRIRVFKRRPTPLTLPGKH
jgi:hypothetical protein